VGGVPEEAKSNKLKDRDEEDLFKAHLCMVLF
jgi:hypothetical protein